ncbi:bifunctional methylenetetrahydrofolate dehydrogenase/cyclohydrolase, mitochondrial isoform X1 [Calonectris borealis]|uniref:bifunctional methylenetetrahydrofolate dehydrogenase/cyclohydrolase, mitochondrial isoform X1 n=1 Tax=Calonectris borealis TaxID=1323832 RepID=UPI003F4C7CBA
MGKTTYLSRSGIKKAQKILCISKYLGKRISYLGWYLVALLRCLERLSWWLSPVAAVPRAAGSGLYQEKVRKQQRRDLTWDLGSRRNDAVVISGRKLARQIRQEARHEVEQWVAAGNKRPHLSVVLVGENPASHSYVLNKTKAAADVGISSETILRPASVTEEELLDLISKLNNDANVDGLLVQLPLPEHIDERKICNAVTPDKDVDGFHVINVGRMCLDQYSMLPATPWGVWEIIKRTGIPTLGKNVVVAGRSKNVGMPIAMLLHTDGRHERPGGDATVTISHRYTPKEQLKQHTIRADIVVAAAGIPNLITADMIKEGAAVIDVGITRVQDPVTAKSRLVGDVDFEGVKKKASYITPVPGGVGPMTVAMLMKNTIIAAKKLLKPKELEALTA